MIPADGNLPKHSQLGDLIYYSGFGSGFGLTYMLTFPQGKLVGSFEGTGQLCPDAAGNVWIAGFPSGFTNRLVEFAHGGKVPIKMQRVDKATRIFDCAVDPTTGDLAAVAGKHRVFIFSGASTPAKIVSDNNYTGSSTYDGSGNLFVQGFRHESGGAIEISELPKGSTKFETVRRYIALYATTGLRWDGEDLTVGQGFNAGGHDLYRYSILRKHLRSRRDVSFNGHFDAYSSYWIQGSTAVVAAWCRPTSVCKPIYMYNYPAGRKAIKTIGADVVPFLGQANVIVSTAPK